MINRRHFLQTATAMAALPALSGCSEGEDLPLPPDVYVGPFGADSTAEEVTAGLDLTGKTALVTGATSGLGYETMRVLAMRGAHVIGSGRTMEKAQTACDSVQGKTTPVVCELTDFESVASCVTQVRALDTPIDMLICNAGIMALRERELVYGLEKHFVVNHLGHFILVNGLLDLVTSAPQGRVVVLSSGSATRSAPKEGILFDNLSLDGVYEPEMGYGHSKLANVLFSLELARRLEKTNATSNALRPGVIMTNLGRHLPQWQIIVSRLFGWLFMKSLAQGTATTCYVATYPALNKTSGHFFEHCSPHRPGGHTENTDMAKRLWDVSAELTADYLS